MDVSFMVDSKKMVKICRLLRQRVCFVCVLRSGSKLKICGSCEIMKLLEELENGLNKLEKFK
jgi:hypothetical protein